MQGLVAQEFNNCFCSIADYIGGTDVCGITTKAEEGHFRLPTSDFGLPTSDFRLPTSDFRLPTSDFGLRTSDFGNEMVDVQRAT